VVGKALVRKEALSARASGRGRRIRTFTNGSRVRCPTVRRAPSKVLVFYSISARKARFCGYCIPHSGNSRMPDYPQPVHGARTPNPASGEWGLVPTSHEKTSASCHCERSEAKQSPGRYGDCFAACGGSQCNGRKFSTATRMAVGGGYFRSPIS
jgi:hypothetical protein